MVSMMEISCGDKSSHLWFLYSWISTLCLLIDKLFRTIPVGFSLPHTDDYIEEKNLITVGTALPLSLLLINKTSLACPLQTELSSQPGSTGGNLAKAQVEVFPGRKVGNELILLSPVLTVVGVHVLLHRKQIHLWFPPWNFSMERKYLHGSR